ncbi:hypothetical protein [Candidatus Desulfosporosinus nitrosoreducens]|uniref:hypothetical protein n=1 Tax=Candidatus Desulfosporosinus nitrosoreducens TaxID=3401928 RepID=UPI00280A616B|nr:hypothetical protein [Desulfosporosinus sp. PR]
MDKQDIKRVLGRLEPDEGMEYRLAEKLNKAVPGRAPSRAIASLAAGLVIVIGTGAFMYAHLAADAKLSAQSPTVSKESTIAQVPDKLTGKPDPETQGSAGALNKQPTGSNLSNSNPPNNTPPGSNLPNTNRTDSNPPNTDQAKINQPANTDQEREENAAGSENSPVENPGPPPAQSTAGETPETTRQDTRSEVPKALPPQSDENSDTRPMLGSGGAVSPAALLPQVTNDQTTGIFVPKIQLPGGKLPGDIEPAAKMTGLIVYQGRIYVQSSAAAELNNAAKLVGEKLGTTKGNLTDWSTQSDYALELASTVGVQDVYTVKGYDKSFRIMTYGALNGQTYANFFECLNGITVKTGNDLFGKFKIENNIASLNYEDFASWNSGRDNYKTLTHCDQLAGFLAALENSVPHEQESLAYLFAEQDSSSQKFLQLKLKDGTEVNLRLFKDGYVYYNGVNIVFQVEDSAFAGLWTELN